MDCTQRYRRRHRESAPSRLVQAGYSIYDLLITSAVASVLGLGAVSMTGMVQDGRMTAAVNQFIGELNLARSESIKRGIAVTLCKTETGDSCATGSEWHTGWIIFVDENVDHHINDGETIIRIEQPLDAVALNFAGALNHDRYVTYKPAGMVEPNGTFTFCDNRGARKAKAVILLGTGRPRVSTVSASNGPLSCS
jgi:type IV fimbrial biogenesis protein FimT